MVAVLIGVGLSAAEGKDDRFVHPNDLKRLISSNDKMIGRLCSSRPDLIPAIERENDLLRDRLYGLSAEPPTRVLRQHQIEED